MSFTRKLKRKQNKKEKVKKEIVFNCKSSLFDRFKAFTIDLFMILMPIMYITIYLIMGNREGFKENWATGWLIILGANYLIVILFWLLKQQTPGLKAYELKIVTKKHKKPNIIQLTIRFFATLLNFILIFPLIIPFLNKDRLTFQDIISRTCIISTSNE